MLFDIDRIRVDSSAQAQFLQFVAETTCLARTSGLEPKPLTTRQLAQRVSLTEVQELSDFGNAIVKAVDPKSRSMPPREVRDMYEAEVDSFRRKAGIPKGVEHHTNQFEYAFGLLKIGKSQLPVSDQDFEIAQDELDLVLHPRDNDESNWAQASVVSCNRLLSQVDLMRRVMQVLDA